MKVIFTLFLFFSSLLAFALTLTCYKCDSNSNIGCKYGILSFSYDTVDCDDELGGLLNLVPKQCAKLVAKVKDGGEYVTRGCIPHLGDNCRTVAKTLGFFERLGNSIIKDIDCFPCDGDNCNADLTFVEYFVVGILIVMVATLVR